MIPTLAKSESKRPAADFILWDECHHVQAKGWRTVLDSYPEARLLGLTATPQRGDGKPLAVAGPDGAAVDATTVIRL